VIWDWISVKPKRQGDGKFLKVNDGFRMAFQVRFSFVIRASILV